MDQTYFKDKWLDDDSPYAIWVAYWHEQISIFSPTMVDNLKPFLATWDK